MTLTPEFLRTLPKVALHDHLDGGLRPQTVIDNCRDRGHKLPTTDPDELGLWFFDAADSGDLVTYLSTFTHTIAAMQTADHLQRVAREFVLDQAADGVIYAEARWAPEQHTQGGLTEAEAVEAVRDGLSAGMAEAAASGATIIAQQLVTSMRHAEPTTRIAELAVRYRDEGVAGFDIAGAEAGFPAANFADAFSYLRHHNVCYTIHAGEADGLSSIQQAVELGGLRLGHGVRLVEDIRADGDAFELGALAAFVRDRRIALEVCPTSNLQTGIAATYGEHPVGLLRDLDFRVTISCDNRLMSRTTLSQEFGHLVEAFGWTLDDVDWCTTNAMLAAFLPWDERLRLIADVIAPAYVEAGR